MKKQSLLLIGLQPLLAEGLQRIFQNLEDVELTYLQGADPEKITACLKAVSPDMILMAGERQDAQADNLISFLLRECEGIPIVWVDLEKTSLRLFTSRSLTASSSEIVRALQEHTPKEIEIHFAEQENHPEPERRKSR